MTFSSSLVIYSSIRYIVYLFALVKLLSVLNGQNWTIVQDATCHYLQRNCLREMFLNISVLKKKKSIPSKHSRQYLWNIVGTILKNGFEKGS